MRQNPNLKKKRLDMAYGNPGFLQDYWNHQLPPVEFKPEYLPYKLGKSILPELEKNIIKIHKQHKNAKISKKTHIVVTNGAVQALSAALYYYRNKKSTSHVYVPVPYWGRFDDLIAGMNLHMTNQMVFDDSLSIVEQSMAVKKDHRKAKEEGERDWFEYVSLITSPNNPDGKILNDAHADIRDACYNWTHYTDQVGNFGDEVTIYSLSKCSGYSSTRIGWALTNSKEAANEMRKYIELFTSGVSIESQVHAASILENITDNGDEFFGQAKAILKRRNKQIRALVKNNNLPVKLLSKEGMFLYIECRPQFIFDLKISCFEGGNFGEHPSEPGESKKYRLNIGVNNADFEDFIQRLAEVCKLYK